MRGNHLDEMTRELRATISRQRDELDGLRRALRTRGVIEQAKGVLAERYKRSPREAFERLVSLSQRTNVKVSTLAARIVGSPDPAGEDAGTWAFPVFDVLVEPLMLLRGLRDSGGAIVDFRMDYCNARVIDDDGRRARDLVGRRLRELYPDIGTHGPFTDFVRTVETGLPFTPRGPRPARTGTEALSGPARIHAAAFYGDLLLTWRGRAPSGSTGDGPDPDTSASYGEPVSV